MWFDAIVKRNVTFGDETDQYGISFKFVNCLNTALAYFYLVVTTFEIFYVYRILFLLSQLQRNQN